MNTFISFRGSARWEVTQRKNVLSHATGHLASDNVTLGLLIDKLNLSATQKGQLAGRLSGKWCEITQPILNVLLLYIRINCNPCFLELIITIIIIIISGGW